MSKEVVLSQAVSHEFIGELLPAAQKTALLYHMSYMCMTNFPTMEKLVRSNAREIQMLFSSTDALLLRCTTAGDNMVNSLLPIVLVSVQRNRRPLAVKYLDKAAELIQNIIKDVEGMVAEYTIALTHVGNHATNLIKAKAEVEKENAEVTDTKEMEKYKTNVDFFQNKLQAVQNNISSHNDKINTAKQELQDLVSSQCQTNQSMAFMALVIPFVGALINNSQTNIKSDEDRAALNTARALLYQLENQRTSMSQKEWIFQTKQMKWQMMLSKAKMDAGGVPEAVHFAEIQVYLTKIQNVLQQIQGFWEKMVPMLNSLRDKVKPTGQGPVEGEDEFSILRTTLLEVDTAKEAWRGFMKTCEHVRGAFSFQGNMDAFAFLLLENKDLAGDLWERQFNFVRARLDNICPSYPIDM